MAERVPHTLYQVSTATALVEGIYQGRLTAPAPVGRSASRQRPAIRDRTIRAVLRSRDGPGSEPMSEPIPAGKSPRANLYEAVPRKMSGRKKAGLLNWEDRYGIGRAM